MTNTAELKLTHCFLTVTDQDQALTFYRDIIGLSVHTDVTMMDYRWLTMTAPGDPHIEIGIVSSRCPGQPGVTEADTAAIDQLMAKGLMGSLIFSVPNLEDTFTRIEAAGATVLQEPTDQPYGVRDCAFRDPFGNMVRINQAVS